MARRSGPQAARGVPERRLTRPSYGTLTELLRNSYGTKPGFLPSSLARLVERLAARRAAIAPSAMFRRCLGILFWRRELALLLCDGFPHNPRCSTLWWGMDRGTRWLAEISGRRSGHCRPASLRPPPSPASISMARACSSGSRATALGNGCSASPFAGSAPNLGWAVRLPSSGNRPQAGAGKPGQEHARGRPSGREAGRAGQPLTFAECVDAYVEAKLSEFRSEKHRKQWVSALERLGVARAGPDAGAEHWDQRCPAHARTALAGAHRNRKEAARAGGGGSDLGNGVRAS